MGWWSGFFSRLSTWLESFILFFCCCWYSLFTLEILKMFHRLVMAFQYFGENSLQSPRYCHVVDGWWLKASATYDILPWIKQQKVSPSATGNCCSTQELNDLQKVWQQPQKWTVNVNDGGVGVGGASRCNHGRQRLKLKRILNVSRSFLTTPRQRSTSSKNPENP